VRRYLLDTDTLSMLVRTPGGVIAQRIASVGEDAVATSPVVAGELRFGALRTGNVALRERVEALLTLVPILPLDDAVAIAYASVRLALERLGTPIGPNDLWIAAHAIADGRAVVTGNVRAFQRVDGLGVEDWRAR